MVSIYEDPAVFDEFQGDWTYGDEQAENLIVEVVDWHDDEQPSSQLVPVTQLSTMPEPRLRIVFAPLDSPESPHRHGIYWLFRHFSVPSAFLEEGLRGVTYSFGALHNAAGCNFAWFHLLYKSLSLQTRNGRIAISDPRPDVPRLDQGDSTWERAGFLLRWKSDDNGSLNVTLLCFRPPYSLQVQLRSLSSRAALDTAALDPFSLFVVILNRISRRLDDTVWDLNRVFGKIEIRTLTLSENRESFTGLHNVAKHIIYLQESCDAFLSIVRNAMAHHSSLCAKAPEKDQREMENTASMLVQVETGGETMKLRLRSLEKRMQNTISLSFHLVTQEGNRFMQSDSNTMTTIAFATLIFLPMTTVSTVFGSQFFNFSDDSTIVVSKDFWIFWLVSVPVTILIISSWYFMSKMRRHSGARNSISWPTMLMRRDKVLDLAGR